jgi:hypothetical protein
MTATPRVAFTGSLQATFPMLAQTMVLSLPRSPEASLACRAGSGAGGTIQTFGST